MPPPERRADSLQALQGLDFFGGEVPNERQLLDWEVRCMVEVAHHAFTLGAGGRAGGADGKWDRHPPAHQAPKGCCSVLCP